LNRKFTTYTVNNFAEIKIKLLNWANRFNIFCLLDNHQYNFSTPLFECLLAAGTVKTTTVQAGTVFKDLQNFIDGAGDWIFGHLAYDLKNETEELTSKNFDGIQFPDLFFFVPEIILKLKNNSLEIGVINNDADAIFNAILSMPDSILPEKYNSQKIKSRFSKDEYVEAVAQIQKHIIRGDCYEINFCQEFYAEDSQINPYDIYSKLSTLSPSPFAAFYRLYDKYLLCCSPERYLKKTGNKIFSEPVKGTSKRDLTNAIEDNKNKIDLLKSKKEISENVMVVDLVRNDLSKICIEGSVKVDELFGVYTFPQVHQMISTVSGKVEKQLQFSEILKATFPMGSMTGVPKKKVMELIEIYEKTKRGLFSGSVGYLTPAGDFDFNVVIRSIFYNSTNKYISLQAGSAITFSSNAKDEYEECLIKIEAMKKVME